jgi:UDP-N-acetylmuramoyl-tripeptide--D-alanyl-D-alanine ligase
VGGETLDLDTNLSSPHAGRNVAAAVATYLALGLPLEGVAEGAAQVALSPWRGQTRSRGSGGLLINDAYNASPISMDAALRTLVARADGRRAVAVLGPMAELGEDTPRYHREVGALAARLGVGLLLAVGEPARGYLEGAGSGLEARWYPTVEAAAVELPPLLRPDDAVLLKASRVAALERLEEALP